jgi:dTDP-4-amino-4,6-dideoxygalactose transaminase
MVVEDCAAALGAEYKGKPVGTFGQAAFFSTEQSKVVSTQMGGMAVTNDQTLGQRLEAIQAKAPFPDPGEIETRLWRFAYNYFSSRPDYGLVAGPLFRLLARLLNKEIDIVSTTVEEVASVRPQGYGKRLPSALAALGIRQLKKLDVYNDRRRQSARRYEQWIRRSGGEPIPILPETEPTFLRYPVYVRDKTEFGRAMRESGIQPGVWFTDVIHPKGTRWHRLDYTGGQCPKAEFAVRHVSNLPTGFKAVMDDIDARGLLLDFRQLPDGDE